MAILFAGAELDAFETTGTVGLSTANAAAYDSDTARGALRLEGSGSKITARLPATFTGSEFWLHFRGYAPRPPTSQDNLMFTVYNENGDRIYDGNLTNAELDIDKYQSVGDATGTVMVDNAPGIAEDVLHTIDIQFVISTSAGEVNYYVDGVLQGTSSTTDTDDSAVGYPYNVGSVDFHSWDVTTGTNSTHVSEIIIADEDTRGMRLVYLSPNGVGFNTGWTGDHTDVDESVLNDLDFIEATGTGQNETFTFSDIAATFDGSTVTAVTVSMRASVNGSPVGNLQAIARPGVTNNFSANLPGLSASLLPTQAIFATNPDTASAWTISEVEASEFGARSLA